MSRQDRLKEYATMKGPAGEASSKKNLDYWADCATQNSQIAPRASDGPMRLPSTGKMNARDTDKVPFRSRSVDARMKATQDMNIAGDTSYLPSIRRDA